LTCRERELNEDMDEGTEVEGLNIEGQGSKEVTAASDVFLENKQWKIRNEAEPKDDDSMKYLPLISVGGLAVATLGLALDNPEFSSKISDLIEATSRPAAIGFGALAVTIITYAALKYLLKDKT